MKNRFYEELELEAKDFEKGDYVRSDDGGCFYLILEYGESWIHKHPFLKVYYPFSFSQDKEKKRWVHEIVGKRKVLRPIRSLY